MLDQALGRSRHLPSFAWSYYPKLLMGYAAASLRVHRPGRVGSTLGAAFDAARSPRHILDVGVRIVLDGIENLVPAP